MSRDILLNYESRTLVWGVGMGMGVRIGVWDRSSFFIFFGVF